jgi:hypothetical protein
MAIISGHIVERIRSATKSHDLAIHNWAISTRANRTTEAQLIKSLHEFHTACCHGPHHLQDAPVVAASCSSERSSFRRNSTSMTLSVDVQPQKAMDCYSRAFLLSTIAMDVEGDGTMDSDSITLLAAIMFYNVGLFYHIQLQAVIVPPSQCARADLECWAVRQYYEKSNGLLSRYLESTREPLWTLQAALWHNLADSYRYRIGNDPVAWIYFEQLESIRGWVDDKSDRLFFERAIAIARMQQSACLSATAA